MDLIHSLEIHGEFIYVFSSKTTSVFTRDKFTYLTHFTIPDQTIPVSTILEGVTMKESLELTKGDLKKVYYVKITQV